MRSLSECLQEAKLCNLFNIIEGLLDVEDTINTNHEELHYNDIVNSEEFKKEFINPMTYSRNGSIEYKNDTLYVDGYIFNFRRNENINIFKLLPSLKQIECDEIMDNRLEIDDTNTPRNIVVKRYFIADYVKRIANVNFICNGQIKDIKAHVDDQGKMENVNYSCNILVLETSSTNAIPKLNNITGDIKRVDITYNFNNSIPELDRLINPKHKVTLLDVKKDKIVNKSIKSFKNFKSVAKKNYEVTGPMVEFVPNAEILKVLGMEKVKGVELIRIGNVFCDIWFAKHESFYELCKDPNGCKYEDLPTTKDGFKCFLGYKR